MNIKLIICENLKQFQQITKTINYNVKPKIAPISHLIKIAQSLISNLNGELGQCRTLNPKPQRRNCITHIIITNIETCSIFGLTVFTA